MIVSPEPRIYYADEVDAYTGPLQEHLATLRARVALIERPPVPDPRRGVAADTAPLLGRAQLMAERAADATLGQARQAAASILAEANEEAKNRLADAEVSAALIVSAVHGRIDSLAIGWEHQLVKQISDTRQGMLSGLDLFAEQLRSSPDDWSGLSIQDPHEVAGTTRPGLATPSLALLRSFNAEPGVSARSDASASDARPIRRRGRLHHFISSTIASLSRSATRRSERMTSGDDPFFNPDLRWKDHCGDDEFLSFLRSGDNPMSLERPEAPPESPQDRPRARPQKSNR